MSDKRLNYEEMFALSQKNYIVCRDREEAFDMLASVIGGAGYDYETTSLHPEDGGKIRLTSVCNDDVHFVIDHEFVGDFEEFAPYLEGKQWFVYNSKFETRWTDYTHEPYKVDFIDVDFMAKAVVGGFPSSLSKLCKRSLGFELDKAEQRSDWSIVALTQQQYDYAAFDSYVTWQIKKYWESKMTAGHWAGMKVLNDAVRGTIEAEKTGLILNSAYHSKLVKLWETKQKTFERYLRRFTPITVIENFRSPKQLGEFFKRELPASVIDGWPKTEKTKQLQMDSKHLRALSLRLPAPFNRWVSALVGYRYYDKYLSTYGEKLINVQNLSGKIQSRFNISQAATGRYSSSAENLQNIPRKPVVRKSFHAPKRSGKLMCLADYKGIEVRTLAEVSGDKQLIHDAIHSDVHATALAAIHRMPVDDILQILEDKKSKFYYSMKADRTVRGKVFTFRLTYGAGLETLADSLRMSNEDAAVVINKWAERYPLAYGYRMLMYEEMMRTGYLPVADGRTIFVHKNERSIPVAANYPIQGVAASVMYRAMYHTHKNFYDADVPAYIAATVHDELLSYSDTAFADEAMQLQLKGMSQGWDDIFPNTSQENLIEWAIGTSWADKP